VRFGRTPRLQRAPATSPAVTSFGAIGSIAVAVHADAFLVSADELAVGDTRFVLALRLALAFRHESQF